MDMKNKIIIFFVLLSILIVQVPSVLAAKENYSSSVVAPAGVLRSAQNTENLARNQSHLKMQEAHARDNTYTYTKKTATLAQKTVAHTTFNQIKALKKANLRRKV